MSSGSATVASRSSGLDALRGLAILLMVLAAHTPHGLPNWMHHGNAPQYILADAVTFSPDGTRASRWQAVTGLTTVDSAWIGMTWVDMVFPMFLFAMGAAIPLAFQGRLGRDPARSKQIRPVLIRFASLVGFAVYVQQTLPWLIQAPTTSSAFVLGVLAFVVLFPIFGRLPKNTPRAAVRRVRWVGWCGAVLVLLVINLRPGHGDFAWSINDAIILILAWCSLAASFLWLATPNRPRLRFGAGFAVALIAHEVNLPAEHRLPGAGVWAGLSTICNAPGALLDFGWLAPAGADGMAPAWADLSVLYNFGMLSCLWLVLPGVWVGDEMLRHQRAAKQPAPDGADQPLSRRRWSAAVLITLLGWIIVFAGLQDMFHRWQLPGGITLANPYTAMMGIPCLCTGVLLIWKPRRPAPEASLIRRIFIAAAGCGVVGVLLSVAPAIDGGVGGGFFEGGPRKVPGSLSWYSLSTGFVGCLLAALMLAIDRWGWRRSASLLVDTGQNPMLAYMAARNLLPAVAMLPLLTWFAGVRLSLDDWAFGTLIRGFGEHHSPWWSFFYGALKVAGLAAVVAVLTRRKVSWSA